MILIGSTYFFKNINGFKSKDIDVLELIDNPVGFKTSYQLTGMGKCVFKWRRMSSNEFIEETLKRNCPMEIGKFLVKDFVDDIGFTIEDLKKLKPLRDNLDKKHLYEAIIYDSYIENNKFELSNEQLMKAYREYIKYRYK
jgi:hypothetical protein